MDGVIEMFLAGVNTAMWVAGIIAGLAVVGIAFGAIGVAWGAFKLWLIGRALRRAKETVAKKAREGKL